MTMPFARFKLLVAFFAMALALAGVAGAQDGLMGGGAAPALKSFDLDFPGGELRQMLDHVREIDSSFQYVLFADNIEESELVVPTMTLRQVNVKQLMGVLRDAALGYDLEVELLPNSPIFRLTGQGRQERDPTEVLKVFNLRPAAEHLARQESGGEGKETIMGKLDDLMTAVQQAISIAEPHGKAPQVSFHPATCLLLIRGTAGQVSAVAEMMDAIGPSENARVKLELGQAQARYNVQRDALEQRLREIELENQKLRFELGAMAQQLDQARAAATTQRSR